MGKTRFNCCIPLCESKYTGDRGVHFFKFPLDSARKQKWIEILSKQFPNINIRGNSRICQQHFTSKHFTSTLKVKISKFAYPDKITVECVEENQIIQHEATELVSLPSTSQEVRPITPQNSIKNVEDLTLGTNPRSKYFLPISY